jgi:hypothetical protein
MKPSAIAFSKKLEEPKNNRIKGKLAPGVFGDFHFRGSAWSAYCSKRHLKIVRHLGVAKEFPNEELNSSALSTRPLTFDQPLFDHFFVAEPEVRNVGRAQAQNILERAAHFAEPEVHADAFQQFD